MAYVRTVKTASGATAVQVVYSMRRGSRRIEHLGSGHDEAEVEALKAAARQRLAEGQAVLDLDLGADIDRGGPGAPARIVSSRAAHLWDALGRAYDRLGLGEAAGSDPVFRDLVLARIVEPTSKLDSLRVLDEVGVAGVSYATLKRRLPTYATTGWRTGLAKACAAHAALGPTSLVLYDVSVRHEALVVRVEVRDHHRGRGRSRGCEAGGSLTGETTGRAGAALTKPWRASTAGWRGHGERVEEVYARNRRHHLS